MSDSNNERESLLLGSWATHRIDQLYSGELQEEEHENLQNELQEASEYRAEQEYEEENSETESLLPEVNTELGTRFVRHRAPFIRQFCSNHKKLIISLLVLLIVVGNALAIYFIYF